ncbi:hypothetical protein MASR1M32_19270 [Rhodobacter sp.]
MMLRLLTGLTLAAGLALALPVAGFAQDDVIEYAPDDAVMEAAIAEARATLPLFLEHALDAKGYGIEGAVLKVGFPTQGRTSM